MEGADERMRAVIARAFGQYRQYHETVEPDELDRAELIGRVGREVAEALGGTVGSAVVPQRDGLLRICLWYTAPAAMPTPEPA